MKKRTKAAIVGGVVVVGGTATGAGVAVAGSDDDATDRPITGTDLDRAGKAALEYTGGGEVTGTEVGDEESYYEVEVTLPDGTQTDVQLDKSFNVVGSESDGENEDEDG